MMNKYTFNWDLLIPRLCLLLCLWTGLSTLSAQTITTTLLNNNGSSVVVFSISNNSTTTAYLLTDIGSLAGFTGTGTARLYAKPATYGVAPGAAGAITAANGWTDIASNTALATVANTTGSGSAATAWITGMSYVIPPQTHIRFCLQHVSAAGAASFATTAGSLRYSTVGVQTCLFANGDIALNTCANYGYGGTMASPTNSPRGLIGFINFIPAVACSGTPTAGTISGNASPCLGANVPLSLSGVSVGTGLTYSWQSSPAGAGTWTGVATTAGYTTSGIAAATDYRCTVTCTSSGQSATTPVFTITPSLATLPYSQDFEGISVANTLPTCMTATNLGGFVYTYLAATGFYNQASRPGGTKFASFRWSCNDWIWLPAFDMQAGKTYQFSFWYVTDGLTGWNSLTASYGTAANAASMVNPIITNTLNGAVNGPSTYQQLMGTFTPAANGVYYVGINCQAGGAPWYLTIDDINLIELNACSGMPTAGNITGPTAICPSTAFNLGLGGGYTQAQGIQYQWQSSPAGANTWTNVGTNATSLSVTGITANTDYRCEVTCTNGFQVAYTPIHTVNINSFFNCYCNSGATVNADEEIYNVTINGASTPAAYANANGCTTPAPGPGSLVGQYSNFKSLGALTNVMQGQTVAYTIEENECDGAPYYPFGTAIWIDFNRNGLFTDPGEQVFVENTTLTGPRNITGSFLVPVTADTGLTAVRITVAEGFSGAGLTPCLSYGYGETEDYLIRIIPTTGCTGTPTAGTATAGGVSPVFASCPGVPVSLSLSGSSVVAGLTYQWQKSLTAGGTYANIGASSSNFAYTISSLTAADTGYYRCVVTCPASGQSATSVAVRVTLLNFMNCYCSSGATVNADEEIYNITVNGGSTPAAYANANGCTTVAPGPGSLLGQYSNFKTTGNLTTVTQGQTVSFTIEENECDGAPFYAFGAAIWIDYNHNGLFTDPGEQAFVETATATGPRNVTNSFLVPVTADTGQTVMRVTVAEGFSGALLTPCLSYGFGETEDFVIRITQANLCTGTPTAGTATAGGSPTSFGACFTGTNGGAVVLNVGGATAASGITYQWQRSLTSGGTYTNVGTAQASPTYNFANIQLADTGYYRCIVTCTNSGQSATTNFVRVYKRPFYECYCFPTQAGSACITNVTFNTLNNTTAPCQTTPGFPANYNQQSATTTVWAGQTYTFGVTCDVAAITSVWIDYNQNGTYETTEWTQPYTNATTGTVSITIPQTAVAGNTGMRVRSRLSFNINGSGDACTGFGSGETEDYVINIQVPPACTGTPNPGTTPAAVSACGTSPATLNLTGYTTDLGISLQWQQSNNIAGPFVNVTGGTGATSPNYTTPSLTPPSTVYYQCVVTCANSGQSATSNVVTVTTNPNVTATITPSNPVSCSATPAILTAGASAGTGPFTYSWAGAGSGSGMTVTASTPGTYTVFVTGSGCTGSVSVTPTFYNSPTFTTPATFTPGGSLCVGTNTVLAAVGANGANPPSSYCQPVTSCTFPDIIDNVTFGTLNRSSACDAPTGGFSYFATPNPSYTGGSTYTLSVTTSGDVEGAMAWIDYNQNGVFEATEVVLPGAYAGTNPATYTGSVTIPVTALNGQTRLRVRCTYAVNPNTLVNPACDNTTFGETEDYLITITGATSPQPGYAWAGPGFTSTTASNNLNGLTLGQAGTYTCTLTDPLTGCTATSSASITVLSSVPSNAGPNSASCGIDPAPLNAVGTGTWSGGLGSFSNLNSPTSSYTPAMNEWGTTVTLSWTSNASCASPGTMQVAVLNPPVASMALAGPSPICAPDASYIEANITGGGVAPYTLVYRTHSTLTNTTVPSYSSGTNIMVTPSATEKYYLMAIVDDIGCTGVVQDTATVVVNAPTLQVAPTDNSLRFADYEVTDGSNWTHYYHNNATPTHCDDYVLLSVLNANSGGNAIGHVGDPGFNVMVSCGNAATTLTSATTAYVDPGATWTIMNRYWNLTPVSQPVNDLNVRFYYTNTDVSNIQTVHPAATPTNLVFYKINNDVPNTTNYNIDPSSYHATIPKAVPFAYNGTGYWQYIPGAGATTSEWAYGMWGAGHYAEYVIDRFSGGGGGSGGNGNGAFPVNITSFTGENNDTRNFLSWVTASEVNSKEFMLLRSSDNLAYEVLAVVPSKANNGNSVSDLLYQITDNAPFTHTYYKLKQIDLDGKESMHNQIVEIYMNAVTKMTVAVYPNPTKSDLFVDVNVPQSGDYDLIVSDVLGRIVMSQKEKFEQGSNRAQLDVKALAVGSYVMTLKDKKTGNSTFMRFVKE